MPGEDYQDYTGDIAAIFLQALKQLGVQRLFALIGGSIGRHCLGNGYLPLSLQNVYSHCCRLESIGLDFGQHLHSKANFRTLF